MADSSVLPDMSGVTTDLLLYHVGIDWAAEQEALRQEQQHMAFLADSSPELHAGLRQQSEQLAAASNQLRRFNEEEHRRTQTSATDALRAMARDRLDAATMAELLAGGGEVTQANFGALQRDSIPRAATAMTAPATDFSITINNNLQRNAATGEVRAGEQTVHADGYGPSAVEARFSEWHRQQEFSAWYRSQEFSGRQRQQEADFRRHYYGEPLTRRPRLSSTTEHAMEDLLDADRRVLDEVNVWLSRAVTGSDPMRRLAYIIEGPEMTDSTRELALWYLVCWFRERLVEERTQHTRSAMQSLMTSLEIPMSYQRPAAVTPTTTSDTSSQEKKKLPRRMITVDKPDSSTGDNPASCPNPAS